jgi:chromosome segregation protein
MPQAEQIQTYYWGALRADPVDLAVDGINVATGPNGSGKTTELDGLKLILGVSDLSRRPAEYIFDGGGDGQARGERALVKVIFANPERPGRAGRVFSDAGRGCESSAHVTAICEVHRDGRRRYAILPGASHWGQNGSDLEADVNQLRTLVPANQWMKPKAWDELLARAGVSRALRGVIAVKQGETDKTIEGTPEMLLKRVLELTGKQQTLEEFREARTKLVDARRAYDETNGRFAVEQTHLRSLGVQAGQHRDFIHLGERIRRIVAVQIPAAERVKLIADREILERERTGQAAGLDRDRAEHAVLEVEIPQLTARQEELTGERQRLEEGAHGAQQRFEQAASDHAIAAGRVREAEAAMAAARKLVGDGPFDAARIAGAEREATDAARAVRTAEDETDALRAEADALRAGRPVPPPGLGAFRAALDDVGIAHRLVAEHLEVGDSTTAEAVLGDGVWGLVLAPEQLEQAVWLAVQHGHRLPLIAVGDGKPTGALTDVAGLDEALAYLAEVDLPPGVPGVSPNGTVRGRTWAAWRAPERPVLGAEARARRLAEVEARLAALDDELPKLRVTAERAAERTGVLRRAADAEPRLDGLRGEADRLATALDKARTAAKAITKSLAQIGHELGRIEVTLDTKTRRRGDLTRGINERAPLVERYGSRLQVMDEQLAAMPKPDPSLNLETLPSVEAFQHEHERLAEQHADEVRYPEEIRSELILAHHEAQQRSVEQVQELLAGRREDIDAVQVEVERAKQRYDEHIRQVVHILARRFRDVCEQAGMEGDIELRPGDVEGEFGIDVSVAHVRGEPKRSYRSPAHSSGQKAKISLLVLLAAMGLEGSADMLIMDEHAAHLDSRNIDAVAEVMNALKHRVQFILATPTNAEASRLAWCDHQIAFYPRAAGESFAPPVRLYTRMPEDGQRYAEMGQLALAD